MRCAEFMCARGRTLVFKIFDVSSKISPNRFSKFVFVFEIRGFQFGKFRSKFDEPTFFSWFFCFLSTFSSLFAKMVCTLLKALIESLQNLQKNLESDQNSPRKVNFRVPARSRRTLQRRAQRAHFFAIFFFSCFRRLSSTTSELCVRRARHFCCELRRGFRALQLVTKNCNYARHLKRRGGGKCSRCEAPRKLRNPLVVTSSSANLIAPTANSRRVRRRRP